MRVTLKSVIKVPPFSSRHAQLKEGTPVLHERVRDEENSLVDKGLAWHRLMLSIQKLERYYSRNDLSLLLYHSFRLIQDQVNGNKGLTENKVFYFGVKPKPIYVGITRNFLLEYPRIAREIETICYQRHTRPHSGFTTTAQYIVDLYTEPEKFNCLVRYPSYLNPPTRHAFHPTLETIPEELLDDSISENDEKFIDKAVNFLCAPLNFTVLDHTSLQEEVLNKSPYSTSPGTSMA